MANKILEKVPAWVEKVLLPNLDKRISSIVKNEVDRVMGLERTINSIDKRLAVIENNPFIVASNNLSIKFASSLLEDFENILKKGNPLTNYEINRRKQLTEKLEHKTITTVESKELYDILTKELEEAKKSNNTLAILLILFLIGLALAKD